MKSRDTVHLYRGPSSWSLWPTTDNSWRVTREVIYKQNTLVMLVIFANVNSSGHFFSPVWHNSHISLESHSYLLIDFHKALQLANPGTYIHFHHYVFSTGSERHRLNPSSFLSSVILGFCSESERQCREKEQQPWDEHFPNLCLTTRRDFDSLPFIPKDLLLNFHTQSWILPCQLTPQVNRWMYHSTPDKKQFEGWKGKAGRLCA